MEGPSRAERIMETRKLYGSEVIRETVRQLNQPRWMCGTREGSLQSTALSTVGGAVAVRDD